MSEPTATPQNDEPQKGHAESIPPWQARIDAMTKKYNSVSQELNQSKEANSKLEAQLAELANKVNDLASRPAPDAGRPKTDSLFGDPNSSASARAASYGDQSSKDLHNIVQQAVQQAFAPMQQAEEQRAKQTALRAQQQEAFNEAARGAPNFANPDTEEGKAFAALWNGHKGLQQLPDGPAIAIAAVQGMLTDARRASRTEAERKHAASVTPSNRARNLSKTDHSQAADLVKNLTEEGTRKGWSAREGEDYIALKIREAQTRNE